MRELDRRAIQELGVPGVVLMENAGRAVVEEIGARWGPLKGLRVHVVCGTGNNGGDGFVAARHLCLAGAEVRCSLAGEAARVRGDALTMLRLVDPDLLGPVDGVGAAQVVVDAVLGTGVSGPPRGEAAEAIALIRRAGVPVVAVDVPSGVDADTGAVAGEAVQADLTVTFGYPKRGLLLHPGAAHVGELVVRDIGFDWSRLDVPSRWCLLTGERVSGWLPPRPAAAHKGDFGRLIVIGGSRGMTGAPTLAARAALRMGVGLVRVACPGEVEPIVSMGLTEAMTAPLHDWSVAEVSSHLEWADAVAAGPGLGAEGWMPERTLELLRGCRRPLVLDADGLNALAASGGTMKDRAGPTVLTPHPGEAARLLGVPVEEVQRDRPAAALELARRHGCVVVLKGAGTLVAEGGETGRVGVCRLGNSGMATAGSGDVLTGAIGALLAAGEGAFEAACAGVYLHAWAGDRAALEIGGQGLLAGDIADRLPAAIRAAREGGIA